MATEAVVPPLVVIVGPTASGKTSLAVQLATEYNGEIICADSRTIYKYMNIGTAKPTSDERNAVAHWGLDLIEPDTTFSAADFKSYATNAIEDIRSRGKTPFLVGGTGLYIDSIIFDFQFGPAIDPSEHQKFEAMDIDQLHEYCTKSNVILPENKYNKRYVIRAIERSGLSNPSNKVVIDHCIVVGIATNSETLNERIVLRTEQLFQNGIVDEAKVLGKKYGWDTTAMTGNAYRIIRQYLHNELTLDESKERIVTLDRQLAKRQRTWFRRNPHIVWKSLNEADEYIRQKLA